MSEENVMMRVDYPNGKPDGVISIEKDGASGQAVAFPRQLCTEICGSNEYAILQFPCVYVLWRPGARGQNPMAYVGETDNFAQRMSGHLDTKEFWTRAVAYSDDRGHLSKTHALQIELWLLEEARKAQVCDLVNKQTRQKRAQNKAVVSASERHFNDLRRFLLPLAGCDFFRPRDSAKVAKTKKAASVAVATVPQSGGLFFLRRRYKGVDIEAQGRETDMGFVVYAGSRASKNEIPTFRQRGKGFDRQVDIRDKLIEQKILTLADGDDFYRFTKDHTFRSPWDAVNVIMGGNYTASKEWKDDKERTLGELQRQKG